MFAATRHLATGSVELKGSAYFDGSGDYLSVPSGYLTSVGTGNFTIEGWWNFQDFSIRTYFQRLWSFGSGLDNDVTLSIGTSGQLAFRLNDTPIVNSTSSLTTGSWNHVAVVRSSGTVTIYINGVDRGSASNSSNLSSVASNNLYIGVECNTFGGFFYGNCSNFRVNNGSAVYTTGFTPSASPLKAISGTSLLTCKSPTAITDTSTNNFTITKYGNVVASSSSPFA